MILMSMVMPDELFPQSLVPRSPETVGELPPAVVEAAKKYFEAPHFDLSTAVPRCTVADLKPVLIDVADKLYAYYPFKINCAYRSVEWDKAHHRNGLSSHCKGYAMDIATTNHRQRLVYVAKLLELGVTRIGIAKTFIHFDVDPDKAASIWLYYPDNLYKTF